MLKKFIYAALFSVVLFTGCEKEEGLGESNIKINEERNEVDVWIYDNLTKPYNIEVKYEFDQSELPLDKNLIPPKMSQVIPFLTVMKDVWIETYADAGGMDFIKKYVPKQIILVGSKNYNNDGTITQGTAEGGRKIVLYQINEFDPSDSDFLKELFHVMHHEFGHILHQNVLYPETYKTITPGGYTNAWANTDLQEALNQGFISPYSKNIVDDDWVEIIAHILTNSKEDYEKLIGKASDEGQAILMVKTNAVVNYFSNVWGIDIWALQADINEKINELN